MNAHQKIMKPIYYPAMNLDTAKLDKIYSEETEKSIIIGLLQHAISDTRLAEITASRSSYWHTSEDCRNIRISIEKLLTQIG